MLFAAFEVLFFGLLTVLAQSLLGALVCPLRTSAAALAR